MLINIAFTLFRIRITFISHQEQLSNLIEHIMFLPVSINRKIDFKHILYQFQMLSLLRSG